MKQKIKKALLIIFMLTVILACDDSDPDYLVFFQLKR